MTHGNQKNRFLTFTAALFPVVERVERATVRTLKIIHSLEDILWKWKITRRLEDTKIEREVNEFVFDRVLTWH